MDARCIPVDSDTTTVTVAQVSDLTRRLHHPRIHAQPCSDHTAAAIPIFVFDAGYDPIALTHELGDLAATIVVRIRDDRVFYTDPAPTEPGSVAGPAATATGSAARTHRPGPPPTPNYTPRTAATAPCTSTPGAACIPNSPDADDGPTTTPRRS